MWLFLGLQVLQHMARHCLEHRLMDSAITAITTEVLFTTLGGFSTSGSFAGGSWLHPGDTISLLLLCSSFPPSQSLIFPLFTEGSFVLCILPGDSVAVMFRGARGFEGNLC